jgi:hypothetical protein
MPAKGPFDFDDGFENIPVVKSTTQAVKNTGTAAAKQAAATTKALVNQLYAQSTPQADDDQQADVNPGAQAQKYSKPSNAAGKVMPPQTHAATKAGAKTTTATADPADDAKLEETRRKLQQQHTSEYFNPTIGDLETQMKRHAQQKKQEEEMQTQQEEQEKKQEMEALEEKKKKEVPMAVKMGRNRAEQHRGASG